jgi:phosphatidylinositol 4-kinase
MTDLFNEHGTGIYMKPYEIIVTSANSGILEFCADTLSVDGLKKKLPQYASLREIYKKVFDNEFEEA